MIKKISQIALIVGALISASSVQAQTVLVTEGNSQGWLIEPDPNNVAPYSFDVGPGTVPLGVGSLQVGPVGAAGPDKFIMFPPLGGAPLGNDDLVADLASFSIDFYVGSPLPMSSSHFYVNLYVNANDGGTGWYDCRYDVVAPGGLAPENWYSLQFTQASAWDGITKNGGYAGDCPATLSGLPGAASILYIAVNAGDTSTNDAGLLGAFDNAVIDIDGVSTVYDFDVTPPSSPQPVPVFTQPYMLFLTCLLMLGGWRRFRSGSA